MRLDNISLARLIITRMNAAPIYLRALRERRGLTQAALAAKSGIEQAHISKLETKRRARSPLFEIVVALAEALGVDPRRLRFGPAPLPVRHRQRPPRSARGEPSTEPGANA